MLTESLSVSPTETPDTPTFYPRQCALCGVVWDRPSGAGPPPPNPPHDHTDADWLAYQNAQGMNGAAPMWLEIQGVEYPPKPPWPDEVGPPPP